MKQIKTWFLIIILIILIIIKFAPNNKVVLEENELNSINNDFNEDIIQVDISNIKSPNTYYLRETKNGEYNISLLYIVLYDDESKSLVSELENDYLNRLNIFDNFIYKETFGKIISDSKLIFMNVKDLGSEKLAYDKNIFDWIKLFHNKLSKEKEEINVIVFVPIYEMNWCQDGLSQGFNYKGDIFFCMESFFNPKNSVENIGAVGLMTHKFLHGVGFNHQDQMYKQYQFIDWQMGLPETNILLHGNFRDFDHLFFDEHNMKVLGLINQNDEDNFETKCLDYEKYVCESENIFFCKDSWGPYCQDIDKDGIVDNEDNYVFSSPKKGEDSDNDGIINELDLCKWNKIDISGTNIDGNIMKIKALKNSVNLSFSSLNENISITKIIISPYEMIGGFIYFKEEDSTRINSDEFSLSSSDSVMWRIKVFYEHKDNEERKEYFRPYYLTFPGFNADFFYEKEWYYFNRFGCDVPVNVDFANKETYDSDKNGLPDENKILWAKKINEDYDWDNDGFSDILDTLPTIQGNCSNEFVKGVKDSDNDGFCDPGKLDFDKSNNVEIYEISMISDYNEFSDLCPYMSGNYSGCRQ